MKVSVDSIVITPPVGIPLAGNGRADSRSRGVHDDLRANYIYIEESGEKLLFIGMDLLGLKKESCDRIKSIIFEKTGLAAKRVHILCTHTHSGPNTMQIFKGFLTEQDLENCDEYLDWLVARVAEPVNGILQAAVDGRIGFGRDEVKGFSFCRRIILKNGECKMVFEEYDPAQIDHLTGPNGYPDMGVFLITDKEETVRGIIVHYTTHPAVVCGQDWLYSRDFIDRMTCDLQRRFGKDVVVLYANGAQGNLVAADPYQKFITGWEEAERVGAGLAEGAIRIANRILAQGRLTACAPVQSVQKRVILPIRKVTDEDCKRAEGILRTTQSEVRLHGLDPKVEAESILEVANYTYTQEETVINAIRIGDTLIMTFPGEVFFEFALELLQASPVPNTMVFGLTDDYVGYIPTENAFSEGGYEVKTSICSSRFAPTAGKILVGECLTLMEEICRGEP